MAVELKGETIEEFDRYVAAVEERINERSNIEHFYGRTSCLNHNATHCCLAKL
jgi:hypothetical protein